jgi:hypothetical protein
MRIYSDTVGATKGVSQNHIGCLTPYSRKLHESLHSVWHSAMVLLHEGRTAALNGTGFLTIKTRGLNILC